MNMRRITALTMLLSFILLTLTSIILYIVPEGRVAYWSDWKMMGLSKTQWGDVHINLGFLFLAAALLHLYYNWKPMTAYMKNRARELKIFTPNFNVALLITLVFTVGTLINIPPFSSILDFGSSFKDAAADKYGEPPYGHAELSSLKMFSKRTGLDLEEMKKQLTAANVTFADDEQTLLEIAKTNNTTPKIIYEHMKKPQPQLQAGETPPFPDAPFPGLGRKILKDLCNTYDLDLAAVMNAFTAKGIAADPDKSLKQIANDNDSDPHALFEIIHAVATAQ